MIRAALAGAVAVAIAAPAWGQELTRSELLEALRQRDQAIAALEKRIETLERERGVPAPAATAPAEAPPPPLDKPVAQASAIPDADDVALQALSRTLVDRGALVLPNRRIELVPGFGYSLSQVQGLVLADTPEGISTVTNQRRRDDSLRASLAFRMGLPWRSQFEARVPFSWMRDAVALADGSQASHDQTGLGDVELELSHQLMREHGWAPDLVGAVSWRLPTGGDPYNTAFPRTAIGSGVHGLKWRLTAVKSSDPMVFFATASYGQNVSRLESFGRVHPGNTFDLELGGVLAVSPETSLTLGFAQDFRAETTVDGAPIAGSDGVASVMELGFGRVLAPNVLLNLSVGVGVTRDAPDYSIILSAPVRF